MKLLVILLLGLAGLAAGAVLQIPSESEVLRLLSNERFRKHAFKCLMDAGPCSRELNSVKMSFLETLKNNCNACPPGQKERAAKMMKLLRGQYPIEWSRLSAKYDPQGVYEKRLKAQLEKKA